MNIDKIINNKTIDSNEAIKDTIIDEQNYFCNNQKEYENIEFEIKLQFQKHNWIILHFICMF